MYTVGLNPRMYKGRTRVSFFLEDKTSGPHVFSSCLFIPRADFETSLVMVSLLWLRNMTSKVAGGHAKFG